MILQTENLTIVRNQQAVISDLNFTLADTEKVVLQGEIGSGKSSFLLALLGFVPFLAKVPGILRPAVSPPTAPCVSC